MPRRTRQTAEPTLRSAASLAHATASAVSRLSNVLPTANEVLAVCAHPDDESFGLGAVLAAYADLGTRVRVLCFTHGEASTLGDIGRSLGDVRADELAAAAAALGIDDITLLAYSDSHLNEVTLEELASHVDDVAGSAELLLAFDEGGITGHTDHIRATEAALALGASRRLAVLGWALPKAVAARLNTEFGIGFVGRLPEELDFSLVVDRSRQRDAIACHASQSGDNPVLWRRLELLGTSEHLRWLMPPPSEQGR